MKNSVLNVDLAARTPIDPHIFGSFIEHIENCILGGVCDPGSPLSDAQGIRQDVQQLCQELAPTALRFPGGPVMGIYHWEEHVGPVGQRRKRANIVWGGRMCHEFGTAEFVQYCRSIGAEPMLCVNMPTGSAEEAANWVEYCNGTGDTYYANLRRVHGYEQPFGVKYWFIGNESYAEPDLGTQHDVEIYIRDAWEFTKYMKMTDPTIELIFVGYDDAWNRRVLDSLGDVCDYLSLHFYAGTGEDPDQPWRQLEAFRRDTLTPACRLLHEVNARPVSLNPWLRIPPRKADVALSLDEWNIWNNAPDDRSKYGLIQTYTWRDALWVASFLNLLLRSSDVIRIANTAQMVNVLAPIMADAQGSWKQTIFHPLQAYRALAGTHSVPASADALDVGATLSGETLTAFAVNRSPDTVLLHLPAALRSARVLRAESGNAVSVSGKDCVSCEQISAAPNCLTFELPPESLCILQMGT